MDNGSAVINICLPLKDAELIKSDYKTTLKKVHSFKIETVNNQNFFDGEVISKWARLDHMKVCFFNHGLSHRFRAPLQ